MKCFFCGDMILPGTEHYTDGKPECLVRELTDPTPDEIARIKAFSDINAVVVDIEAITGPLDNKMGKRQRQAVFEVVKSYIDQAYQDGYFKGGENALQPNGLGDAERSCDIIDSICQVYSPSSHPQAADFDLIKRNNQKSKAEIIALRSKLEAYRNA